MAQHDYVIDNQPGAPFRGDLNAALQAILTNNLGGTPAMAKPGMLWLDNGAGSDWPNGRLRLRSATDTWIDLPLAASKIAFPSTAVPSADPYTLDDYREGTFVPTIIGQTTAGVGTYQT